MSAHRALFDMLRAAFLMTDPGSGGTITVDRWNAHCPVVTAGAESRTLAQPTKSGLLLCVELDTRVGDLTLTVTGGYNQAADTSIVFGTAGDWVLFKSSKVGSSYYWRVVAQEGTNLTRTGGDTITSQTITTLTSTTGAITNTTVSRLQVTPGSPIAAAGADQTNAAALAYGVNIVTGANNAAGVRLPTAVAGGRVEILQTANNAFLNIYPAAGGTIAGLSANAALNSGLSNLAATAGTTQNAYFKFLATNTTQWYVDQ